MARAVIAYDKDLPEIPGRRPWEKPTSYLVKDDAAIAKRSEERLVRDEAEVSRALQRLSDAAALRPSQIVVAASGTPDPLARALAVIAAQEGFNLRLPQDDNHKASVIDRLGYFANASSFRFRAIALGLSGTDPSAEMPRCASNSSARPS